MKRGKLILENFDGFTDFDLEVVFSTLLFFTKRRLWEKKLEDGRKGGIWDRIEIPFKEGNLKTKWEKL